MFLSNLTRGLAPSSLLPSIKKTAPCYCLGTVTSTRFFSSTTGVVEDDAPSAQDIADLQDEFRANPESAQIVLESKSKLTTGLRSTAMVRDQFQIKADEPFKFGGTDTAHSPVEIILASLGTCQEITYKAYAQAMEIPVQSVSLNLEGEIDMRGFFSVDDNVRPGIHKITGVATVETTASVPTEQIEQLKQVVDQRCPVSDMLQAVPITITLEHVQV